MLLARYALAIIDSERACTRRYIQQLQLDLQGDMPGQLRERAERLMAFAETRQRVRLDASLLPALRTAARRVAGTSEAERASIEEMEQLAQQGGAMLPALQACLGNRAATAPTVTTLLQAYCSNLALRLDCEETRLLPLACHLLSAEAWFHVGAAFLRHDEKAGVSNYAISAKVH